MTRVVLASASPRRRELLAALVDGFEVVPSDVPEELAGRPEEDAVRLAGAKARAVAASFPGAVVIGSDTIVHDGERAYGKPRDAAGAEAMLTALRGRPHRVITGVAVVHGGSVRAAFSSAEVVLSQLSDGQVRDYVASGRPLDKAGAYAIQDEDVPTVAALRGCCCCVVGLPLWLLRGMLQAEGVDCRLPGETFARCQDCPERPRAG